MYDKKKGAKNLIKCALIGYSSGVTCTKEDCVVIQQFPHKSVLFVHVCSKHVMEYLISTWDCHTYMSVFLA